MNKAPAIAKPILSIDLKIRFQSRVYKISVGDWVRWIVPIAFLVVRLMPLFRSHRA